jgi:hypothetical protein
MILKKGKRIEKNIFINTGKIEIVWVIGIWNLRFVWNLMLEICDLIDLWRLEFVISKNP